MRYVEHEFAGLTSTTYDKDKTTLIGLVKQFNTGSTELDKYLSTPPPACLKYGETVVAGGNYLHVIRRPTNLDVDWVFIGDMAGAGTTRRVSLCTFTRSTWQWGYVGYITFTPAGVNNHTMRGLRATYDTYTTGTVQVTGTTAVTGNGTDWLASGICVGNRIGFGSTDPEQITTWYQISAVGSATGITLTAAGPAIGPGAAYVIEDLRIVMATTSSVATTGGLNVAKGLRYELFTPGGTVIAAGTTADNARFCYWLCDNATTQTNTIADGLCILPKTSWTNQDCYVVDNTATPKCYKYNLRAPLAGLASGKSVSAWVLATGAQAVTGTVSQANNGRIATTSHGNGSGVPSLYFATASRIYRAALSNITSGNATWTNDSMQEVPPGGVNTYPVTGTLNAAEYLDSIDRFFITTTTKSFLTKYYTAGEEWDETCGADYRALDSTTGNAGKPLLPSANAVALSSWGEAGVLYIIRGSTTTNVNQVYAIPVGAHWNYNTGYAITPKIALPGVVSLTRAQFGSSDRTGDYRLGLENGACKVSYRTTGMDDNTGNWTALDDTGSLQGQTAALGYIQFKIEWQVIGSSYLPQKIYNIAVAYEDSDYLPSQFQWNMSDSSTATGVIGFKQVSSIGSVPTLTIQYYRGDNSSLVLSQASSGTTNGTFEYHNGSTWVSGVGTDTAGLRRRFTPTAGLPTGVDVYTKLQMS